MRYFISDLHFSHSSIIEWERNQFNNVTDHDIFILNKLKIWASKYKEEDEFYICGDWGNISFLPVIKDFKCKTIFVAGNHDKLEDKWLFEQVFDEVYWHPIYLSERIIVSHYPQAVWPYQINICGHLHGMKINDQHYITCSINDINYIPVNDRHIESAFGLVHTKMNNKFLWEPWADNIKVTNKLKEKELVCGPDGIIDVSASRLLQKQIHDKSWKSNK